jgi:hypothetical protein
MHRSPVPVPTVAATAWWLRLWGCIAVLGALFSPLILGATPAVTTWVSGCAMGLVASALATPIHASVDWSRASGQAALWGAAFAALTSALQVWGPAALWVPMFAVVTSPWAIRDLRRLLVRLRVLTESGSTGEPPAEHAAVSRIERHRQGSMPPIHCFIPVDASPAGAAEMDTERLCHAWRRSFLGLEAARGSAEALEVVRVRQILLDELHLRHRPEMRAWISAGGRAASGPDRFLSPATPKASE